MNTDEFGGIPVESRDEFGGIAVAPPVKDDFGGVAVEQPAPSGFLPSFAASASQTALSSAAAGADMAGAVANELAPKSGGTAHAEGDQSTLESLSSELTRLKSEPLPPASKDWGYLDKRFTDYYRSRESRMKDLAREIERLQKTPADESTAGVLRDAAQHSFEYYGVDPRSKNLGAQVGRGAGAFFANVPAIALSLPAAVVQMGGASYEGAYAQKQAELKSQGVTDPDKINEEAQNFASKKAVESVPELAAYMVGGKLASGAVSKLLPAGSAIVRGLTGAAAGTAANSVTSATLRGIHGENIVPTVEQLSQDALWGLVHGKDTYSSTKEAQSILNGTHPAAVELAMRATDRYVPPDQRTRAETQLNDLMQGARDSLGLKVAGLPAAAAKKAEELKKAGLPATAAALETKAKDALEALAATDPKMSTEDEFKTKTAGAVSDTGETSTPAAEEPIDYSVFDTGGGMPNEAELDSGKMDGEPADATASTLEGFPVYEQPIANLSLSSDVPNFKSDADEKTGVVEGQQLSGKYQRLGTGAITVWERTDGRREVVSGRHRFDLAKRQGEQTIPSQLVREADGWTKQRVARLDAEANIRDGQGSVRDYANYFRNSDGSQADAEAGGLLARSKGRAGFALGRHASGDLYSLYQAGKIKESHAVAIVSAAPGQDGAQRVGIAYSLKNPRESAESVGERVKASIAMPEAGKAAEQGEFWDSGDSQMQAMDRAAEMAIELKKAAQHDVEVLEQARKRRDALKLTAPEAARFGIDDRNNLQQIESALAARKGLAEGWDRWHLDPEKKAEVFARAGITPREPVAEKPFAGDVIPAGDMPFNLAGEKADDPERVAREAAQAEKDAAEAKAAADRDQTTFFSYSKKAGEQPAEEKTKQAITGAYADLVRESGGFPAVSIAELAERAGVPLEEMKRRVLEAHKQGEAVLSIGDWSLSSDKVRSGAVDVGGDRMLQVRFHGDLYTERAERREAAPERPSPPDESKLSGRDLQRAGQSFLEGMNGYERRLAEWTARQDPKKPIIFEHGEVTRAVTPNQGGDVQGRKWRVTTFDARTGEPAGHTVHSTREEAVMVAKGANGKQVDFVAPAGHLVAIHRVAKKLSENVAGVRVRVVRNERDLPQRWQDKLSPDERHEGLVDTATGEVYLLADNIDSPERAAEVFAHEVVGHFGIERIIKPEEWQNIATSIFKEARGVSEAIALRYTGKRDLGSLSNSERSLVAREYVARLAEGPRTAPGLWERVVTAVQGALRRLGVRTGWSEAELRGLIRQSSREVEAPVGGAIVDDGGIRSSIREPAWGEKRSQVGGIEQIGHIYTVRNIAETRERIQAGVFNGTVEPSAEHSAKAWDVIESLTDPETSRAAADRANSAAGNDIGAAMLQNELLTYAVNNAATDGGNMLRHLLGSVNLFETSGTSGSNVSTSGAILRARGEFDHPLWAAYSEVYRASDTATARVLAGKGHEDEGRQLVQAIKTGLNELHLTPEEVMDSLELIKTGGGESLRQVLNRLLGVKEGEFTHDNPMLTAMVKLASHSYEHGLNFEFRTFNTPVGENIKETLKPALANFRTSMEKSGADKLERAWWSLMAGPNDREGHLSKADRAVDAQLGGILKETMKKMGLVNEETAAKLTDPEKVAQVLGKGELRRGKVKRVDEQVRAEIDRRETEELDNGADEQDTKAKYELLREQWDVATRSMLDVPVSEGLLRRMVQTDIRDRLNVDWNNVFENKTSGQLRVEVIKGVLDAVKLASAGHTEGLNYGPIAEQIGRVFDHIAGVRENRWNMGLAEKRALEAFRIAMKPEQTAEKIVAGLAKSQSDTLDFSKPAELDPVRKIVTDEFKRKFPSQPPMRAEWKSRLVAKLVAARLSESTASKLADTIWREHQSRAAVREMRAAELATERGALAPIVQSILSTPLRDQGTKDWIEKAADAYFRNAGLSDTQAKQAATVFAKQFGDRLADARESAARSIVARSAPWQRQMSESTPGARKKLASDVDKIIAAVRAGVTDPGRTFSEEVAKQNGWTGFSHEQHARLAALDSLINHPDTKVHEAVRAQNEILKIVERSKVPRTVWENIASAFHNSLLSGLPTISVNIFGPFGFMFRDVVSDLTRSAVDPARFGSIIRATVNGLKTYGPEFKWALKNDVYTQHFTEHLNHLSTLDRWIDEGTSDLKAGRLHTAIPKLLFGSTDYLRRVLSSLDQAGKSMRLDYASQIYGSEAMRAAGYSRGDVARLAEAVNVVKERAYEDAVRSGMSPLDAKMHGIDSARDALTKGLSDTVGPDETAKVTKATEAEADLIVGHDPDHINEGLLSGLFPNKFLDAVSKFRSDANPATRIISTVVFGLITVPYRMLRFGASYSPYGLVRYAIHKYQRGQGGLSRWEQSMGTKYQERQRLTEGILGTALMGGLLSMYKPTTDDKDDDRDSHYIHITGAGPDGSDKLVQDAWRKRHRQFAMEFKFAGKEWQMPYGRGAGEAFLIPLSVVGAYDDYRLANLHNSGKRIPSAISMPAAMASNYISTMSQRGAFVGLKNAGDLLSRSTTSKAAGVTSVATGAAANFIPWNRLMQTVGNFFQDTPDRSSVRAAIIANVPIVAPLMSKPALNGLGDPIGDQSTASDAWFGGAPVVMKVDPTPMNKRIYGLIREKGQAPPTPIRSVIERRYRTLSDVEWYKFVHSTGQQIKSTMNMEFPELHSMAPDEFNAAVGKYSTEATADVAERMGLSKRTKP